jgi:hypothetical protein
VNKNEEGAKLEEPGLNMELLYAVHDSLREMVSWDRQQPYPDTYSRLQYLYLIRLHIERDMTVKLQNSWLFNIRFKNKTAKHDIMIFKLSTTASKCT